MPDEVRLYNAPRVQGIVVWPVDPEKNRPNIIPESLSRTSYWYRTELTVPANYAGRQIWLNFEGINYVADVWVNGKQVGTIKGAFIRGDFNVTALVTPGKKAALAVRIAPLPRTDSADVSVEVTVNNASNTPQTGTVSGKLGDIAFRSSSITLAPNSSQLVKLNPQNTPQLRLVNPKLWWPNGFGEPNLYPLHLSFDINGVASDAADLNVGIRELAFFVEGSRNLTLSVNSVRVFAKGGNWGMDEMLKRIPRQRLGICRLFATRCCVSGIIRRS